MRSRNETLHQCASVRSGKNCRTASLRDAPPKLTLALVTLCSTVPASRVPFPQCWAGDRPQSHDGPSACQDYRFAVANDGRAARTQLRQRRAPDYGSLRSNQGSAGSRRVRDAGRSFRLAGSSRPRPFRRRQRCNRSGSGSPSGGQRSLHRTARSNTKARCLRSSR